MTDLRTGGKERRLEGAVTRAEGEIPTVAQVYRQYAAFVWRIAGRFGCPSAAIDDVVHEVFLVVHRRLKDFDTARSMKTWLFGITRNVVLHQKRGAARRTRRIQQIPTPAPVPDLDEQLARADAVAVVEEFLRTLDEDKRAVFSHWAIDGMTAPEISESLGVNVNTVYSRLRVARKRFEALVKTRAEQEGELDHAN